MNKFHETQSENNIYIVHCNTIKCGGKSRTLHNDTFCSVTPAKLHMIISCVLGANVSQVKMHNYVVKKIGLTEGETGLT